MKSSTYPENKTDHLPIYTTQPGTQVNKQSKIPTVGVTINNDLTWNHHINNITNKANASLRFIKRNIKTNSIKTKELAYQTYVRPKVEYCSVVWDPWQK